MAQSAAFVLLVSLAAAGTLPWTTALSAASADADDQYKLPDNFLIGAGVSALQTEGAWNKAGKAESFADHLFHLENIGLPVPADVTANSYERYKEDVAIAKKLKIQMYRLSLSWSRLLPTADASAPNPEGVAYYHSFIDEIIKNGMQPLVTLFHFDHPQSLQKEFLGWESDKMTEKFKEYAAFAFNEYGEKVKLWVTQNEPNAYCMYFNSLFKKAGEAPAESFDTWRCMKNFLVAHKKAYRAYPERFRKQGGRVGTSVVFFHAQPTSLATEDIYAAETFNELSVALMMDPIVFGEFPAVVKKAKRPNKPTIELSDEDKRDLKDSTDFIGINIYSPMTVGFSHDASNSAPIPWFSDLLAGFEFIKFFGEGDPTFSKISPKALSDGALWVWQRYGKPIMITENGPSSTPEDGLHDPHRSAYFSAYLRAFVSTIRQFNMEVLGYSAWSLIDCLEWSTGYGRRFGLAHVDYESGSLNRTLRESSSFFIELAETRRVPLVEETPSSSDRLTPATILMAACLQLAYLAARPS